MANFTILAHHEISVFPERETPFFIMFTAGLCTFTALIAFLTHQYPDQMAVVAKTVRQIPVKGVKVNFTNILYNLGG